MWPDLYLNSQFLFDGRKLLRTKGLYIVCLLYFTIRLRNRTIEHIKLVWFKFKFCSVSTLFTAVKKLCICQKFCHDFLQSELFFESGRKFIIQGNECISFMLKMTKMQICCRKKFLLQKFLLYFIVPSVIILDRQNKTNNV